MSTLLNINSLSPRDDNPRLFMEKEKLEDLRKLYKAYASGVSVVLPDPPIVRPVFRKKDDSIVQPFYEILRGHRRVTAAALEGVEYLPCRVVNLNDEEAYRFLLDDGEHVSLTTIELAHRAAEMERLGFSEEEINEHLGGVSIGRYLLVGSRIDPEKISDNPKLCDPPITIWYEAALLGQEHFDACLSAWDLGLWDLEECFRRFRKQDERDLPLDNKQKGLRLSVSPEGDRMNVIGRLDASLLTAGELAQIWERFKTEGDALVMEAIATGEFGGKYRKKKGKRYLSNINPDTLVS